MGQPLQSGWDTASLQQAGEKDDPAEDAPYEASRNEDGPEQESGKVRVKHVVGAATTIAVVRIRWRVMAATAELVAPTYCCHAIGPISATRTRAAQPTASEMPNRTIG